MCEGEVSQSCPTLCNPMDCSLLGSSVHGIFQVIVLEWVAISFFLQGNFPTQGSNLGLPHCRQMLYRIPPKLYVVASTQFDDIGRWLGLDWVMRQGSS